LGAQRCDELCSGHTAIAALRRTATANARILQSFTERSFIVTKLQNLLEWTAVPAIVLAVAVGAAAAGRTGCRGEEWTSLKKDFIEHKCYAEDLGFIGNLVVKGATKRPSW